MSSGCTGGSSRMAIGSSAWNWSAASRFWSTYAVLMAAIPNRRRVTPRVPRRSLLAPLIPVASSSQLLTWSGRLMAQGLAWGRDQGVNLAVATDFMRMARGLAPRKKGFGQCLAQPAGCWFESSLRSQSPFRLWLTEDPIIGPWREERSRFPVSADLRLVVAPLSAIVSS